MTTAIRENRTIWFLCKKLSSTQAWSHRKSVQNGNRFSRVRTPQRNQTLPFSSWSSSIWTNATNETLSKSSWTITRKLLLILETIQQHLNFQRRQDCHCIAYLSFDLSFHYKLCYLFWSSALQYSGVHYSRRNISQTINTDVSSST